MIETIVSGLYDNDDDDNDDDDGGETGGGCKRVVSRVLVNRSEERATAETSRWTFSWKEKMLVKSLFYFVRVLSTNVDPRQSNL